MDNDIQIKKETSSQAGVITSDDDGFILYDPRSESLVTIANLENKDLNEKLLDNPKLANAMNKLENANTMFFHSNVILSIINVFFISYWFSTVEYIEPNNKDDNINTFQCLIIILLIVHCSWLFTFFIGYNMLRYQNIKQILFYYTIILLLIVARIAINMLLILNYTGSITTLLSGKFNLGLYAILVGIHIIIDGVLVWYMIRLYQTLINKIKCSQSLLVYDTYYHNQNAKKSYNDAKDRLEPSSTSTMISQN